MLNYQRVNHWIFGLNILIQFGDLNINEFDGHSLFPLGNQGVSDRNLQGKTGTRKPVVVSALLGLYLQGKEPFKMPAMQRCQPISDESDGLCPSTWKDKPAINHD